MSTEFVVHSRDDCTVEICERSGLFDLDLNGYTPGDKGPQRMEPAVALTMAIGIIYAVWCSHPIATSRMIDWLANDYLPELWNKIQPRKP